MPLDYTEEHFFSLREEYERLSKVQHKSAENFTQLETLEDQILPCAKHLAENESNVDAMYWLCDQALYGTCRTGLTAEEFKSYLQYGAGKDHLPSIRLLAKHYYGWDRILSVSQINKKKAMKLFEKAAETDDIESRFDLALALIENEETKDDLKKAKSLLKGLMKDGYAPAFYSYYSKFYLFVGLSAPKRAEKAFEVLQDGLKAIKGGKHDFAPWFTERMLYLSGLSYAEGIGCEKDIEKAIRQMKKSAEVGAYNDAYFWLKNKGLEKIIENPGTPNTSMDEEVGGDKPDKPIIFSSGNSGTDGIIKSGSDFDSTEFYENTTIELENPLTFINFDDNKGRNAGKEKQVMPDLTKEDLDDILKPFENLIGLDDVKEQIRTLFYMVMADSRRRKQGLTSGYRPTLHMVFSGNPGTGKTTVARLVGDILKRLGYLKRGHVVEVDRSKMVGEYIGQSEQITSELFKRARDGVLFIDEAYDIESPDSYRDYGRHIISMLVKAMEDTRNNMVVIMAGYRDEMSWFIEANPGLRSRVGMFIDFPDYTDEELVEIFATYSKNLSYTLGTGTREKIETMLKDMQPGKRDKFGNARGMRNLFDETIRNQARRVVEQDITDKKKLMQILPEDLERKTKPETDGDGTNKRPKREKVTYLPPRD